jgi:outer membrane lipoprotein-sorting protein
MAPPSDSAARRLTETARRRRTACGPTSNYKSGVLIVQFCIRLAAVVAVCGFSVAGQTWAATLPAPSVEYSADRLIETSSGTFNGKVFSAKDKERAEMNMSGMQSVMILRRDKQLGWMLMPAQKMYMTVDFAKAQQQSGAAPNDQVEITEVGTESVEGFSAKKYKMLMKDGSGGGFIWITEQGIPVKMDMLSKSGGEKSRMTVTLKNLKIGSQEAQLFDLPAGFTAMPSMGNLGMRP